MLLPHPLRTSGRTASALLSSPLLKSRLVTCVLVVGFACCGAAGCGAATGRPDAEVARLADAEDRRLAADRAAHFSALASTDLAYLELAAAGAAIETIALLYVPSPASSATAAPAVEPVDSNPDWVEGPPPSWLDQPWPHSQALDPDGADVAAAARRPGSGGSDGPVSFEGGGRSRRQERKASKPKLRMDLLNLHIRGRPVSFSASLKGLKGVQFKAVVKM